MARLYTLARTSTGTGTHVPQSAGKQPCLETLSPTPPRSGRHGSAKWTLDLHLAARLSTERTDRDSTLASALDSLLLTRGVSVWRRREAAAPAPVSRPAARAPAPGGQVRT